MKEPLLILTTEKKPAKKLDELRKEIHSLLDKYDYQTAAARMLDWIVLPLPSPMKDLRTERRELEQLRRKAGRGCDVWVYCGDRIELIDHELDSRFSCRGRAREWVIIGLTVLVLAATVLFGFGILHPRSTPPAPSPIETPTAPSDDGKQ